MKVYYNRTQLARQLGIAPETLRAKISEKLITADAKDARGFDLFSEQSVVMATIALTAVKTGKQKGVK